MKLCSCLALRRAGRCQILTACLRSAVADLEELSWVCWGTQTECFVALLSLVAAPRILLVDQRQGCLYRSAIRVVQNHIKVCYHTGFEVSSPHHQGGTCFGYMKSGCWYGSCCCCSAIASRVLNAGLVWLVPSVVLARCTGVCYPDPTGRFWVCLLGIVG